MKHLFSPLFLLVGSLGAAHAQTPAPAQPDSTVRWSRLGIGATGGAIYASFTGPDARTAWGASYRWGFQAGLTADIRLGDNLSFHPEALYAQQGAKFSYEPRNRTLTYVHVPLLVRYYPGAVFGANSAFFEVGPRVSTLLTAKNNADADAKAEFNSVDAGVIMGAGYRLAAGLSLGLRYDIGLTKVYRVIPAAASGGRGDYQPDAANGVFSVLLAYTYGFKK